MGNTEYDGFAEKHKYSLQKNRTAKVTQIALISTTILEALLILALVVQLFSGTDYGALGIVPVVVLIGGLIANWIIYIRDKSNEKLKYVMLLTFIVGWGYLMLTGTNVLVTSYIYPILIAVVLYYDMKFEKIIFYAVMAITVLRIIIWGISGFLVAEPNAIPSLVVAVLVYVVVHIIAKCAFRFNGDTVGALEEKQEAQSNMLRDILHVSENVEREVTNADALMDSLSAASDVVCNSVQEISQGSQATADSVQEQTEMTGLISQAINETAEDARIMVEVTDNSAKMLEQSMEVINSMRQSAATIGETNSHVAESMQNLQEKAKEVQQITEVIFNISSQTNMLALNASIESARAGEAGKGFSVVADQIRQLAEETRKSTEKISAIIQELNVNAQNATEVVQSSIDAMSHQNEMIESASDGFAEIHRNMDTLAERVTDVDEKIRGLVESNNRIIESITQLSATSEEVSANAQEAESRSLQNQMEAQKTKELLGKVTRLVHEFSKYQA